jgi:hypothetical protein
MTLSRRDVGATLLTALAVLAFFASHESWDVRLISSSDRWTALAITVLGVGACALGAAADEMGGSRMSPATKLLSIVGAATGLAAIWAIASGSSIALTLLTVGVVVLWAGSTVRHAWHLTHHPVAT